MNVGIVTFYRSLNYGAMLQAYALWHILSGFGCNVEFVRHSHAVVGGGSLMRCFISRRFSVFLKRLRLWLQYKVSKGTTDFAKNYPQTRELVRIEDFKREGEKYDLVVVGSDQMWNPRWVVPDFMSIVFLDFVPKRCVRISYAVSFSVLEWGEECKDVARDLLQKMDGISVREMGGAAIVKTLSGRDAEVALDPVLLFGAQGFAKLANVGQRHGKFIFKYMINGWRDELEERDSIKYLKNKIQIHEIIDDSDDVSGWCAPFAKILKIRAKTSVPNWLARISECDFVVTNSFHGLLFAVLFHRPFVVFRLRGANSEMNVRVESMLRKIACISRLVDVGDYSAIDKAVREKIDWDNVEQQISEARKASIMYLRKYVSVREGCI